MKRLALLLLLAGCDKAPADGTLHVRWLLRASEPTEDECNGAEVVVSWTEVRGGLAGATGSDNTLCADGQLDFGLAYGFYGLEASLYYPMTANLQTLEMNHSFGEETTEVLFRFLDPPDMDAGMPDASLPDAGTEDASVDAMPDAGPAGPDEYTCICQDATMIMGCADIAGCTNGLPVPGSLCTDACASHTGLATSYCSPDDADCL